MLRYPGGAGTEGATHYRVVLAPSWYATCESDEADPPPPSPGGGCTAAAGFAGPAPLPAGGRTGKSKPYF